MCTRSRDLSESIRRFLFPPKETHWYKLSFILIIKCFLRVLLPALVNDHNIFYLSIEKQTAERCMNKRERLKIFCVRILEVINKHYSRRRSCSVLFGVHSCAVKSKSYIYTTKRNWNRTEILILLLSSIKRGKTFRKDARHRTQGLDGLWL